MSRFAVARSLFGVAVLLIAGCGGDGRYEVTGTVTFKGAPVEKGTIRFDPAPGGGSSAAATISGGRYTVPAAQGLLPGKYRVSVTTVGADSQATDRTAVPGSGVIKDVVEPIPAKYNEATTLNCEVTGGKNTHDFKLD